MTSISRESVVAEALTWKGTPFIQRARIKGAGADCFTFVAQVMVNCGFYDGGDRLPPYHQDWFLHANEEHYTRLLLRFSREILTISGSFTAKVEPGNIVAARVCGARLFNHAGIVTRWPMGLHCIKDGGVCEFDALRHPMWMGTDMRIFDPFGGDA